MKEKGKKGKRKKGVERHTLYGCCMKFLDVGPFLVFFWFCAVLLLL